MKKLRVLAIVLIMLLSLVVITACGDDEDNSLYGKEGGEKLYVYNWYDYIDEGLIEEFVSEYEEKYGVSLEVVYSKFDTNEVMMTQVEKGGATIDIVCPSEYTIEKLIKTNKVKNINDDSIWTSANIEKVDLWTNIDQLVSNSIDATFSDIVIDGTEIDMTDYFVPYMWGTLGILYNAEVVTEEDLAEGWGLLWNSNNNPELDGKIYLKDSIRDSYVAAVLRLKELNKLPEKYINSSVQELINTVDDELTALVKAELIEQKKVSKGYEVDLDKVHLIDGSAYVCLAWSGDAVWSIEEADLDYQRELAYFTPHNEGNVWFDGWAVLESCQNVRASLEFINFMNRPESAIRNSIEIGYTSAVDKSILESNQAVLDIIAENEYDAVEFFADEVRYPSDIVNMGVMKDFGENTSSMLTMWEGVKSSGNSSLTIVLIVAGAVLVAGVVFLVVYMMNGKGKRRVKK